MKTDQSSTPPYPPDCADCPTPVECKAANDCAVLRQIRHPMRAAPSRCRCNARTQVECRDNCLAFNLIRLGIHAGATQSEHESCEPSAYLFNGNAYLPKNLTPSQRAAGVPLYAKAIPSETGQTNANPQGSVEIAGTPVAAPEAPAGTLPSAVAPSDLLARMRREQSWQANNGFSTEARLTKEAAERIEHLESIVSASGNTTETAKWKAAYERANAEVFMLTELLRKADPKWGSPMHVNAADSRTDLQEQFRKNLAASEADLKAKLKPYEDGEQASRNPPSTRSAK